MSAFIDQQRARVSGSSSSAGPWACRRPRTTGWAPRNGLGSLTFTRILTRTPVSVRFPLMPDEPVNLGEIERLLNEIAGASVDIQNHLLDLRDHAQEQSKSLIRIAGALEKIAGMNETEIEGDAELESLSDAELERPAKSNEDIRWSDDP